MVKKIAPDGTVTVYQGLVEYEIAGGVTQTTSYYTVPGARVVRVDSELSYVLTDHLGSSSVTLDDSGALDGELRYYAYGETRVSSGNTPTERLFTGQLRQDDIGLDYFNARWYLAVVGRFISADTIVPNAQNAQAFNRYSYVFDNPIRHSDPSGHRPCDEDLGNGNCGGQSGWYKWNTIDWIQRVRQVFAITLGDDGAKRWSQNDARLIYASMSRINNVLDNQLFGILKGANVTFRLQEQMRESPEDKSEYNGWTQGTLVDFYTMGSAALRQQNIFHEFGHVIDNLPSVKDTFSGALGMVSNPSWEDKDGFLDTPNVLVNRPKVADPNYIGGAEAIQHPSTGPIEQWADIFANYVAGNVNQRTAAGAELYKWTNNVLTTDLGSP